MKIFALGTLKVVINGIVWESGRSQELKEKSPPNLKGTLRMPFTSHPSYFFFLERLSIFKWGPPNTGCNAQHDFTNLNIYKYSINLENT